MNNINNQISQSEKKQIEVKIGNIKYNLTTTESEEYIHGIAKYINNKINEISSTHLNLKKDSIPFFLTMALNITDDLFKQRKQFTKNSNSLKQLEKNLAKINEDKQAFENLKTELNKKKLEIISLNKEVDNISNENEKKIISLKENFENIIKTKDKEISSLNETISSLEEKIKNVSLVEDESISLLYEKDQEISSLKQELEELSFRINVTKNGTS